MKEEPEMRPSSIKHGVWRPVEGRIVIKMPFREDNRFWLKSVLGSRIRPEWNKEERRWEIARAHFGPVVEALAARLGRIDVWVDFRTSEKCDVRCRRAKSRECTCSCMGKSHGQGITRGWKLVGDTTLVQSTGTVRRHMVIKSQ